MLMAGKCSLALLVCLVGASPSQAETSPPRLQPALPPSAVHMQEVPSRLGRTTPATRYHSREVAKGPLRSSPRELGEQPKFIIPYAIGVQVPQN